jgi:hypothetical protein
VIDDVRRARRPPRPSDPSQNQWLRGRVWDVITTCWDAKPERRCELSVMHHIFSTPSSQDLLLGFPPAGCKNLIRLAEEFYYTFLVHPLDPALRATLGAMQEYISNVMSRDGHSPPTLSSVDAAALSKRLNEVSFPTKCSSASKASSG